MGKVTLETSKDKNVIGFFPGHDKVVHIRLPYEEPNDIGVNILIKMTEKAQRALKDMQHSLGGETYVRFGINRPCCNQMNYTLSLAISKKDHEEILILHDIKMLIDPSDSHFTDQTEIDYEGDGYLIRNPHPLVSPII